MQFTSLVPDSREGRGKESLVQTICACAYFTNIPVISYITGDTLRMCKTDDVMSIAKYQICSASHHKSHVRKVEHSQPFERMHAYKYRLYHEV